MDASASPPAPLPTSETRRFPWWVLAGAVLVPCLYLPTLGTGFDFTDDGNLVYPAPPMSLPQRLALMWEKVEANVEDLGPFRPVLWAHWELAAELYRGNPFCWRLGRLGWSMFATGAFLWLLRELRVRPLAALAAVALTMWNPYRNEIWTSLTLGEGVAMPYALLGLACAVRAGRSGRPLGWDLLGAACVLAALGCKNTFAALVPAQMFLRLAPDGQLTWEAWRRRGPAALLLSLTLLLPVGHFIYFKTHWHPGQYTPGGPSAAQLGRYLVALQGAVSLEYIGLGVVLSLVALAAYQRSLWAGGSRVVALGAALWRTAGRCRAALGAAALLLLAGVAVYLPMDAISGRYTMPAVWGLDIALAVLLSGVAALPRSGWKTAACAALAVGLAVTAGANVGKQLKFAARSRVLWDALAYVERTAPPGASIAWISSDVPAAADSLNPEEGVHFEWHLHARGRTDLHVVVCDEKGKPVARREAAGLDEPPTLLLSGQPEVQQPNALGADWQDVRRFRKTYWCNVTWFGARPWYDCHLFRIGRQEPSQARAQ